MQRMRSFGLATLLLVTTAAAAAAQGDAPRRSSYIAINPLGIPFELYQAEVEFGITPGITIGALASLIGGIDDDSGFNTLEAKLRFYPNEGTLRGFSIGLTAGRTAVDIQECLNTAPYTCSPQRRSSATIGTVVDYNWLLGRSDRFLVGVGVGAKRMLSPEGDMPPAYPTVRLVTGWTF